MIHNRLRSFLNKYNILTAYQNRFQKSTVDAILEISDKIVENLEDFVGSVCTVIDLTKAFDTVDHKILLEKYELYGLQYVTYDRKQYVSYNNLISDIKTIYCGVPQGSVLGPLLILLYVIDLPKVCRHSKVVLFADGCAFYTTTETGNQQQVNSDTSNVEKRFWRINLP